MTNQHYFIYLKLKKDGVTLKRLTLRLFSCGVEVNSQTIR